MVGVTDTCRYLRGGGWCAVRAILLSRRDASLTPRGEGAYAECERCLFRPRIVKEEKPDGEK